MSKSFVQVPPQSTGKRILTEERKELYYDNAVDNFNIGDIVTGSVSNASGIVTGIATEGFAINEGEIYLKEFTGTFVNDENLQVLGSTIAVAKIDNEFPQTDFDMQKVVISDPNNPENSQRIDRFGATVNTFTDGSPIFGPFGTLTTGEPQIIKWYRFAFGNEDATWFTSLTGGATNTWEPNKTATLLTCGTAAGDKVVRTTNYRHPYFPGIGQSIEWTAQFGDAGKTGLRRRMGYFDENDGVFFEQEGTTLYVVLRSSITGSVVETRIPQTEWNIDRADGTDAINFVLDKTKANMYWIDLQWHGAGTIKFGVYEPEGTRIALHAFRFASNSNTYPYMRTATLPLRLEQENTGSTISSSEMRFSSAVVRHTSKALPAGLKLAHSANGRTISNTDGEVPILAIRPKLTLNGQTNWATIKGLMIDLYNKSITGTQPIRIRLRVSLDGTGLTGGTFIEDSPLSATEWNDTATSFDPAKFLENNAMFVAPNDDEHINLDSDLREAHSYELQLCANGTSQPIGIITAEVLGTGSAEVFVGMNIEEYYI